MVKQNFATAATVEKYESIIAFTIIALFKKALFKYRNGYNLKK